MKKRAISTILVALLALSACAGCGSGTGTPSSSYVPSNPNLSESSVVSEVSEESSKTESSKQESSEESSKQEINNSAPKFVKEIYDNANKIIRENNMNLSLSSELIGDDDGSYEFNLTYDDTDKLNNAKISFWAYEGKTNKTFKIQALKIEDADLIKSLLTLSFMITDNNLSLSDAKVKTKQISNSYKQDTYSNVIDSGDYKIFLTPVDSGYGYCSIVARNSSEIWDDSSKINKSEYSKIDDNVYNSPDLNIGEKFVLEGTVKNTKIHNYEGYIYFFEADIEDNKGKVYKISYPYEYNPVKLKENTIYRIYGTLAKDLSDNPCISVVLPEKID